MMYITECTSVMSAFYGHNFGWCMTVVHASCQSYCMLISDPTRRASLQTIECVITVHVLTFETYCTSLCMCMYTLLILTALIGYTCARLHCYERFQSNDWHHRSRSGKKLNSCCWASRLSPCIIRTWCGTVFFRPPIASLCVEICIHDDEWSHLNNTLCFAAQMRAAMS